MISLNENHLFYLNKDYVINKESFEVHFQQEEISLTPKEFSMIALFLEYQNKVFSREHLINTVWGFNVSIEDRTID